MRALWTLLAVVAFLLAGCANEPAPPPTAAVPVVVEPVAPVAMQFSDGRYLVATHSVGAIVPLPPGKYATDGEGGAPGMPTCMWTTYRDGVFIGAGYAEGLTTVTVNAGEQFEVRGHCTWRSAT